MSSAKHEKERAKEAAKQRPLPESLCLPCVGVDSHAHLDSEQLWPDFIPVPEHRKRPSKRPDTTGCVAGTAFSRYALHLYAPSPHGHHCDGNPSPVAGPALSQYSCTRCGTGSDAKAREPASGYLDRCSRDVSAEITISRQDGTLQFP